MFKMSEAAAGLCVLAAGILVCAPAVGADQSCTLVTLEPGSKAEDVKAKLKLTDKSTFAVDPVGSSMLVVCSSNAAMLPVAREAIERLAGRRPESNEMRLFFHRDGKGLAAALDQKVAGIGVKSPDNSDLLIFDASPGDENSLRELKRVVTLLDAPRPEITLNAWSVQVSAPKQEIVVETANKVRSVVYRYNQQLQEALERGWEYLTPLRRDQVNFAKYFAPYVLERYEYRGTGPGCANGAYWYCLGYKGAFSEAMQPSLTNMIGILASFADAKPNAFVDSLEAGQCQCDTLGGQQLKVSAQAPQPPPASCDELDEQSYRSPMKRGPHFACFREQLKSSLKPRSSQLARLRIAMADFLFQYKFSVEYPHDFDYYDYAASAQHLDVELDPLLVAFNHDLVIYLRDLQHELGEINKRALGYSENGIVTVRTISGTDSSVSTQSQSSFKTTPPPLANDFLNQLQNPPNAISPVIGRNLPPNAAQALVAFLNSGQGASVTLARDFESDSDAEYTSGSQRGRVENHPRIQRRRHKQPAESRSGW